MDNTDLKQELVLQGVILPKLTLCKKFKKILTEQRELLEELMIVTDFLEYDADVKTRVHCVISDITSQPKCTTCSKVLKMRTDGKYRFTFPKTCGSKCFALDDAVIQKRKKTNLLKYGATNFLASPRGISRSKMTLLKRYGVTNPARIPGSTKKRKETLRATHGSVAAAKAEAVINRKKTMVDKYGVEHAMHVQQFKDAQQQTCLDRYGVHNPWLSDEIQQHRVNTMVDKYGVAHALQNEQLKHKQQQTMVDVYGVAHALQNEQLKDGAVERAKQTMLESYGCHFNQQHISTEALEKLHDADWLSMQHQENKRTLSDIALELKVQHSTVGRYFKIHSINVLSFNFSQSENDLANMITSTVPNDNTIRNTKNLIPPLEIDVFVQTQNTAFEYNGIYWHSELQGKTKRYHINKTNKAALKNIRLVHIFEHEWLLKRSIVESRIRSILGATPTKIHARRCDIVQVDNKRRGVFMEENHIQGDCPSSISYGLYHDNELVACMTFGKARFSKAHEFELIRFANKLNSTVVGGASRLFAHFIKTNNPQSIITYSDKRWNTGKLYNTLGFQHSHTSAPNYHYFHKSNNLKLLSRVQFQKHKLANKLATFDASATEWENMVTNGYDRIWDCGNDVYAWNR